MNLLRPLLVLSLAAAALVASADIVVVAPTSTAAGSFTITAPITFDVTAASASARFFVLQGLVSASDGNSTFSAISPSLAFRLNGVPVTLGGTGFFVDNLATTADALAPRDGYFLSGSSFTVAAGDTVTLDAATYTLAAISGFNPLATGTFTGDAFLANSSGTNRLSSNVSVGAPVPEPASMAALGLGAVALLKRRKRG